MGCRKASNPIKTQGDKICDFLKSGGEGKRAISEIGGVAIAPHFYRV